MRRGERYLIVAAAVVCAMLAAEAMAQQASAIAGVAKDTSGAVWPSVTVEATSPALIEKSRTATTDSAGRYKINSNALLAAVQTFGPTVVLLLARKCHQLFLGGFR
jgi:hypothetical protein